MEHQYNQRFWTHKNARFWPPFCNSHRWWWQHRVLSDSTTHCSNVYFWNIFSCGVQNMSNSIFLEFFLWLCLLIKAHGNNMSCDVVKRGRSCYFHEWNLHIWNYLFLPLFYHVCLNWHLFYMCGYFWILSTALHGALLQGKRVIHACRWSSRYTWTEWMDWKHSKHIINFAMLFFD